jgi:sugar fermentation stimulation protein A
MKYENITEGVFLSRPNRFIANVLIDGREEVVHVKNTGRCRELVIPGVKVFLEKSNSTERKTKYDLVAVYKGDVLYNIDSIAPNKVFGEYITTFFNDVKLVKSECKYKNSRFDFYVEYEDKKAFVEVKGVTLENGGVASFPDAPTQRGVKHINELISAVENGYKAYVVFVIQMKGVHKFTPNDVTHKEFGDTLRKAQQSGVEIIAVDCIVKDDEIYIDIPVPVELKGDSFIF